MACAASIWNWAISNFNPILFMPFKSDFGRGTENKQKKSKLGLLLTLYPIRGPRKWSTIFFSNISPGKCGRCGHVRCQDNYHVRCQDNYHVAKCVWLNAAAGSFSRNGQRSQRDSQSEICTSTLEKILKTISCASSLLLSLCH